MQLSLTWLCHTNIAKVVHMHDIIMRCKSVLLCQSESSSNAGTPFKCHYWLAQCGVYLAVMLVEKLIVGPLIIFDFWNKVKLL